MIARKQHFSLTCPATVSLRSALNLPALKICYLTAASFHFRLLRSSNSLYILQALSKKKKIGM